MQTRSWRVKVTMFGRSIHAVTTLGESLDSDSLPDLTRSESAGQAERITFVKKKPRHMFAKLFYIVH